MAIRKQSPSKKRNRTPRVADEIMSGMRELQRMMDSGKSPAEMFTVRTVEVPNPRPYSPHAIRALRESLGVSQGVFAHLLGVSVVLVKSWEGGARKPSPMARRLMDTIQADPARWLTLVRQTAAA